ncbi:MAG: hypothetical protein LBG81_05015 [Coriobacteriaceae bacterium]|jgi:molecular chaperone GrpE (heat shock protein)|nr:hypothetical protein [Coriobacteriaceae bacterium]
MKLDCDIVLDEGAFKGASSEMAELKARAQRLKERLEAMYRELEGALQTPAGEAVGLAAADALMSPMDDLLLAIQHISDDLTEVIGTGRYKGVFIKYGQLNDSIGFD